MFVYICIYKLRLLIRETSAIYRCTRTQSRETVHTLILFCTPPKTTRNEPDRNWIVERFVCVFASTTKTMCLLVSTIVWTMQIIVQSTNTHPHYMACIDVTKMVANVCNGNRNKQIDHHLLFGETTFLSSSSSNSRTSIKQQKPKYFPLNTKWQIPNRRFCCRSESEKCLCFFLVHSENCDRQPFDYRSHHKGEWTAEKRQKMRMKKQLSGNGNHILELVFDARFSRFQDDSILKWEMARPFE